MMNRGIYNRVIEALDRIPIIDVHSHLDITRPQANDIGDILFYHFLRREFSSAGGDDGFLVSDRPLEERVAYYLKYLHLIKGTSTYWCVKKILRDLYGLEDDLDESNWRDVNRRIMGTRDDSSWPEALLTKRLKIQRCYCCMNDIGVLQNEVILRRPFLFPHLEAFSFGPNYVEGLMTFVKADDALPEDLDSALGKFAMLIKGNLRRGIRSFGSAIDEDLAIIPTEDEKADQIYQGLSHGEELSIIDRNILVTKFLYKFLETIKGKGVAQWYLGAVWKFGGRRGPYEYGESYVRVKHELIPNLIKVFKDFPSVNFNLMYCSESMSQEMTIVARMLRNVTLLGFWWHNLFPSYVERLISERIESLPANKWILVGTDAYCCEWCYGKISLVKRCLAKVLSRKIEEDYLTMNEAKSLARRILYENALEIYRPDS